MKSSQLCTMLLAILSSACVLFVGYAQQVSGNATVSALFAFGDSILDTGNNNNLKTMSKCNVYPYGRNFVGRKATGRFGDGRVFSDIIAEGLGLKNLLPAYRDPTLSDNDLTTGVCFASGGSGLDEHTAKLHGVIWMSDQVKDFGQYKTKLNGVLKDPKKSNEVISNAVYLISAGNNDLAFTYTTIKTLLPITAYTDRLITWTEDLLKSLYDMGARKFAVLGTLPLGCLPGARILMKYNGHICIDNVNYEATLFNTKLAEKLDHLKTTLPGAKFVYVDMYNPLLNLIDNPQASGFVNVSGGCCCMPSSPIPCLDESRYVFWDYGHPSERSYQTIAPKIIEELKSKLA